MDIVFYKYQGTGNDFIMINNITDDRLNSLSQNIVRGICARHTGIGADGLIILNNKIGYDFDMEYYNSDGNPSTMCGNGGRCAVAFAKQIGAINDSANFLAIDGAHQASISDDLVTLGMRNVSTIQTHETFFQLDTGSPHYVTFVEDINTIKVAQEGALIRNSPMFKDEGINVNFVQELNDNELFVRTYERGVEDETLSCGTGVTACALVQMQQKDLQIINIKTLGGELTVSGQKTENGYMNIDLKGPATFVFEGILSL